MRVSLHINRRTRDVDVEPHQTLLDVLRQPLQLLEQLFIHPAAPGHELVYLLDKFFEKSESHRADVSSNRVGFALRLPPRR